MLTSEPVQNMGHFFHGSSLAFPSHVLRYGLRTMSGRTGGVRDEASATPARSAVEAVAMTPKERIAMAGG
jgi:hypothetical protein